jgi:ActR/RegA family two-component response regulator
MRKVSKVNRLISQYLQYFAYTKQRDNMSTKVLLAGKNEQLKANLLQALEKIEGTLIVAQDISLAIFLCRKNFPNLIIVEDSLSDNSCLELIQELQVDEELRLITCIYAQNSSANSQAVDKGEFLSKEMLGYGVREIIDSAENSENLLSLIKRNSHFVQDTRYIETTE